ncbi:hypothetical protein L249_7666 [Ophiocordyceps polyrhachis-furcata BCC 54312]|uniref:Uncharacterized protein n=1 Tax=Ophiocordyceps polyrhachis-furcata BCC 54312 TaxID=1330021 RepID=A0A367LAT9_9HYPO|nr:hypothetical protein L249_7666 [Ophiocordyceps polyrhachis-furcata BCC 54312]
MNPPYFCLGCGSVNVNAMAWCRSYDARTSIARISQASFVSEEILVIYPWFVSSSIYTNKLLRTYVRVSGVKTAQAVDYPHLPQGSIGYDIDIPSLSCDYFACPKRKSLCNACTYMTALIWKQTFSLRIQGNPQFCRRRFEYTHCLFASSQSQRGMRQADFMPRSGDDRRKFLLETITRLPSVVSMMGWLLEISSLSLYKMNESFLICKTRLFHPSVPPYTHPILLPEKSTTDMKVIFFFASAALAMAAPNAEPYNNNNVLQARGGKICIGQGDTCPKGSLQCCPGLRCIGGGSNKKCQKIRS